MRGACALLLALLGPAAALGEEADAVDRPAKSGKGAVAVAEEATGAAPALAAELRLVSNYLWRGYSLSQDAPALQPWAQADWRGLAFSLWASAAVDRHPDVDDFSASLSWHRTFGQWGVVAAYSIYVAPGTQTAASADPDHPLRATWSGELQLAGTLTLEHLSAQLAYGRGHRDQAGNAVGLWVQGLLDTPWEWLAFEPYLQIDYMDEYEPPPTLRDRMSSVEAALQLHLRRPPFGLVLVGSLVVVPSPYVRGLNASAGSTDSALQPYAALAFAYEPE